jgi:uncharacterized protein YggE
MTILTRTIVLLSLCCASMTLQAAETSQATIVVTGEGTVTAVPNQATVTTGVETQAPGPKEALDANSATAQALLGVLNDHGIESRDIQTSGFSLSPQYRHPRDGNGEAVLTGYSVSNQLLIRVRDLERLGGLLNALVEAGSNRLSGIEFGHADIDALTDQARRSAIAEARRRAELYAEAAGVRVGTVISITETGQSWPQPMFRVAAMDMAAAPPVAAGEQQIQASVQVVFALEPE